MAFEFGMYLFCCYGVGAWRTLGFVLQLVG